jgi:hypothetical protein
VMRWWLERCISVSTFQFFMVEASAGEATVMSMQVIACEVLKVGDVLSFRTHRLC